MCSLDSNAGAQASPHCECIVCTSKRAKDAADVWFNRIGLQVDRLALSQVDKGEPLWLDERSRHVRESMERMHANLANESAAGFGNGQPVKDPTVDDRPAPKDYVEGAFNPMFSPFSPLLITMALEFWVGPGATDKYRRDKWSTDSSQLAALDKLERAGLLERTGDEYFAVHNALRPYVKALTNVPFPKREWVMP